MTDFERLVILLFSAEQLRRVNHMSGLHSCHFIEGTTVYFYDTVDSYDLYTGPYNARSSLYSETAAEICKMLIQLTSIKMRRELL